jgi:uncharacterized protein with NAD-binding domain and iron-sulfur cluster
MGKRVVIAGGGIAGMTAAMLLAEQGFEVVLCEASGRLGGKANSGRTPDGNPTEHSLRVFWRSYLTLLPILARIPAGNGRAVLDNLVGYAAHRAFAGDPPPRQVESPARGGRPWGPLQRLLVGLARPWLVLVRIALVALVFARKFRARGVPVRDSLSYLLKHFRLLGMCSQRVADELGQVSYADYLGLNGMSPAARRYFAALPQIIVAARPDAEAGPIVRMMLRVLLRLVAAPTGLEHLPARMMIDGPTGERFLVPWTEHLRRLGVTVLLNSSVTDLDIHDSRVRSVLLADGRRLEADHFILALPFPAYRRLVRTTGLSAHVPDPDAQPLRLEWSNGVQVFLKDLPADRPAHFAPGVATLHLDSPWAFVSVIQGPGFWRGVEMAPGTRYVLSATWSEAEVPGPLTGEPMTACTRAEIVAETLAQCGFPADGLVTGWQVDREIAFFDEAEYQTCRTALRPHLAAAPFGGKRVINYSPLTIRLPQGATPAPQTSTRLENLFLAGEHVHTAFGIPTMESAAESGARAAAEAARRSDERAFRALSPDPSDREPFRWLRRLDGWLFRRQLGRRLHLAGRLRISTNRPPMKQDLAKRRL